MPPTAPHALSHCSDVLRQLNCFPCSPPHRHPYWCLHGGRWALWCGPWPVDREGLSLSLKRFGCVALTNCGRRWVSLGYESISRSVEKRLFGGLIRIGVGVDWHCFAMPARQSYRSRLKTLKGQQEYVEAPSRWEDSQRQSQTDQFRFIKLSNYKRVGFSHTTASHRMNRPRFAPLRRP